MRSSYYNFKKRIFIYLMTLFLLGCYLQTPVNNISLNGNLPTTGIQNNQSLSEYKFSFNASESGLQNSTTKLTETGVSYIATKKSDQGNVEVFVDNVSRGIFDLYSQKTLYRQNIFSISGLANGNHIIEIKAKKTKNTSSSGFGINLDSLNTITWYVPDISFGDSVISPVKYVEVQSDHILNLEPDTLVNLSALAYDNSGNRITDATSNDKWLWSISPISPFRGYLINDGSNNQAQFNATGIAGSVVITAKSELSGKTNSITLNINDALPTITAFSPIDNNVKLPASDDTVANVIVPAGSNSYLVTFNDLNIGDWVSPDNSKIAYERGDLPGTNSGISSLLADNYDIYVGGFSTGAKNYSTSYTYSIYSNNFSMTNILNAYSGVNGYIIFNARQNGVVKRKLRINIIVQ